MQQRKLKIGVHSMDGVGHLSACAGIMQPLIARGHDVFFLANSAFEGKLAKYGAREVLLSRKMTPEEAEAAKSIPKNVGTAMVQGGFIGPGSSIEKMKNFHKNGFFENCWDTVVEFEPKMEKILAEEKPDLLLVDHFLIPPSFVKAGVPYVIIHSCSPLMAHSNSKLPPPFSGFPTDSDPESWKEFQEVVEENFFSRFRQAQLKLFHEADIHIEEYSTYMFMSPFLNIYAYPKELDYDDIVPRREDCFAIDAFARDEPYEGTGNPLPEHFMNREEGVGLVYFSLGSMGGADVELMKRITAWFPESKHKFVVVKGPRGDEYELDAPNIYSGNFLPQPAILPHVDLVITHGGNNTTTETFFAGKPLIVLPLFADQYDNGRRVEECGFGLQFNPYHVTKDAFMAAIDKVLFDKDIKARLQKASQRMRTDDRKIQLAIKLEQLAQSNPRPVALNQGS